MTVYHVVSLELAWNHQAASGRESCPCYRLFAFRLFFHRKDLRTLNLNPQPEPKKAQRNRSSSNDCCSSSCRSLSIPRDRSRLIRTITELLSAKNPSARTEGPVLAILPHNTPDSGTDAAESNRGPGWMISPRPPMPIPPGVLVRNQKPEKRPRS